MKLAFFGAGKVCREAIEVLDENGQRPDCIIDNDSKKAGQRIYGIPIVSFESFSTEDNGDCQILITAKQEYVDEIKIQIENNGFKNYKVYERSKEWGAQLTQSCEMNGLSAN